MFMFTEINYRLSRTPGRSLILMLAAIMLVAGMGAYLGNLQASKAALNNLAESIPVTVRVVNRSGTQTARLSIDTAHFDALLVVIEADLTLPDCCGPGFLSGGEALCGISEAYAQMTS